MRQLRGDFLEEEGAFLDARRQRKKKQPSLDNQLISTQYLYREYDSTY